MEGSGSSEPGILGFRADCSSAVLDPDVETGLLNDDKMFQSEASSYNQDRASDVGPGRMLGAVVDSGQVISADLVVGRFVVF